MNILLIIILSFIAYSLIGWLSSLLCYVFVYDSKDCEATLFAGIFWPFFLLMAIIAGICTLMRYPEEKIIKFLEKIKKKYFE